MKIDVNCPYCGYEHVKIERSFEWTEERSDGCYKGKGSIIYCFSCNNFSEFRQLRKIDRSEI